MQKIYLTKFNFHYLNIIKVIYQKSIYEKLTSYLGFPGGSDGKGPACNARDPNSIPGLEDLLDKGMATHTSNLAWRIPWTEEPGKLEST